ncbi:MAG: hypothetical protein KDA91_09190 [Planctomycetaceae bacterium]|nr:hypothetical protein [Planctomycetaceae bacterium]
MGNSVPKDSPPDGLNSALQFRQCIRRICQGSWGRHRWAFLQLRGEPLHTVTPCKAGSGEDADDVDLLGDESSVYALVDAAFEWVRAGECHIEYSRRAAAKATLVLYSLDGNEFVQFDLWMTLAQIDGGQKSLQFPDVPPSLRHRERFLGEDCSDATGGDDTGLFRLPPELEVCLYIQHLICKRKNLRSARVRNRLDFYESLLNGTQELALVESLGFIRTSHQISVDIAAATLSLLQQQLVLHDEFRSAKRAVRWWQSRLDGSRPSTRMLAFIGCDGTGKTTLAHFFRDHSSGQFRHNVGKHLYRKTILYKLLVIFVRPLISRDRDRFDDLIAPVNYMLAALRLRILTMLPDRKWRLFDRCIHDFLFIQRKSDAARFSRWQWLAGWIGIRIRTVHLVVSRTNLQTRRDEITDKGHGAYDHLMQQFFTRQIPVHYTAQGHDCPVEVTAGQLLKRIVQEPPEKRT